MEQYLLTQEDIDRLGLRDAIVGDLATEQELRALFPAQMNERDQLARQAMLSSMEMPATVGGTVVTPLSMQAEPKLPIDESEILPPDVPVEQQITGTTASVIPSAGEDVGAPLQASGIQSLLSSVATQPEDPYSNLSKTQKRMLAFAAISDAGAALKGMQGRAVRDLMSDFTARADMQRKERAAQMRQEMLSNLMGAPSGMTGDMNAQKQQIMGALAGGLIDGPTARIMLDQLSEQEQKVSSASKSSALMADIDLLSGLGGLDQLLGVEGIFTRGLESLNLGALRPDAQTARSILNKIKGGVFLAAFESLKGGGQITELEGQKAEQAQARLLETQSPEAFRDALAELRFYSDIARRRAMGEYVAPDTIYESKLGQPDQPTDTDDLTPEEKKRLGLD
jgi:hypothetical protein